MTEKHQYSFFGNVILTIQSSSIEKPFIFLTCIRKIQEGEWEKPSKGEGKTIKCNIEEMAMILQVLKSAINVWTTEHEYKEQKTSISFKWEDQKKEKERWLRIQIGGYTKMLNLAQVELFKILLKHIIKEKLIFSSSQAPAKVSDKQDNGLIVIEEIEGPEEKEHLFEFEVDKAKQIDKDQGENVIEDVETPKILYDVTKGNYIDNIFYELETEKAVMFGRNTDDKVLWIPKSAIKGGWNNDKKTPQSISLSYTLENLGWVPRKKQI